MDDDEGSEAILDGRDEMIDPLTLRLLHSLEAMSTGDFCFDRAGAPITIDQWKTLWEVPGMRGVKHTVIAPDVHVSTVWLGLDHGRDEQGRPLIFETRTFGRCALDQVPYRYSTELAALHGHDEICELVRYELELMAD